MAEILGLIIMSCFISAILFVPFIDFLYKIKLRRQKQQTRDMFDKRTPLFDKYNSWKVGTPFGGGILIILLVTILSFWAYGIFAIKANPWEMFVIFFSFISFGLLGLYDDLRKLVNNRKNPFWGLRFRHKFFIQWILAFIVASALFFQLHISFINIHWIGKIEIGMLFIPFAAFIIVAFVNAFNITDGLDGLASGVLLICLTAFLLITQFLDPTLGVFIAVLLGSIIAFLYFNIYKARLWLGDVGSLSLGAALAVIGLLTGKTLALGVIGGVFVLEVASSLMQLMSKKYLGRKIIPAAPLHLYFLKRGWEEPKIVMRTWLIGIFFAIIGLYTALAS